MDEAQTASLDLSVVVVKEAASVVRDFVKERATKMLRKVLEEIDATGAWKFIITGLGSLPTHQSQYWMMAPEASTMMVTMAQTTIRSSLIVDGVVTGMLMLPKEVDRLTFLREMIPIIDRYNGAHWQNVIEREERESMRPSGQVVVDGGSGIPRSARAGGTTIPRAWSGQSAAESNRIAAALADQRSGGSVRLGHGRIRQGPLPLLAVRVADAPDPAEAPLSRPESGQEQTFGQWTVRTTFVPRLVGQRGSVTNALLNSTSLVKGSSMNTVIQGDLGIQVSLEGTQSLPSETNGRLKPMLEALLTKAKAPCGQYQFVCKGRCKHLEGRAHACAEAEMGIHSDVLVVSLHVRGGQLGSVYGNLRLPAGTERKALLQALDTVLEELNKSRWNEVLDNIPPNPPPERRGSNWNLISSSSRDVPPASSAQQPTVQQPQQESKDAEGKGTAEIDAAKFPVAASSQSLTTASPSSARLAAIEAVNNRKSDDRQERVEFLLAVLKRAPSGVFFWRDAREDQRLITGNRIGLSQTLLGLGWIVSTGLAGQYRITEEFRQTHAPEFKFAEQAKPQRPAEVVNDELATQGENGATPAAIPVVARPSDSPVPLASRVQDKENAGLVTDIAGLLSQRQAIDTALRQRLEALLAERDQLREKLVQVEKEVAAIEAVLSPAR